MAAAAGCLNGGLSDLSNQTVNQIVKCVDRWNEDDKEEKKERRRKKMANYDDDNADDDCSLTLNLPPSV